jgi:Family of unknown function (DUF6152)
MFTQLGRGKFVPDLDQPSGQRTAARVRLRAAALLTALVSAAGSGVPLAAHHSFAMFDTTRRVTLEGTVTAFEWTNPHAYIELDVADAAGPKHWSIELGSPSILMQGGWKFKDLKYGDKITVIISPLKSGQQGGLLSRITMPDGRVLGNGPIPAGAQP